MARNFFNRYIWLINTVQTFQPITFERIREEWYSQEHKELPKKTFINHRKAIEDMFGIVIKYDKPVGYRISDEGLQGEVRQWLLDSMALNSTLRESASMCGRISLEEVPSGKTHLTAVIQAMKDNRELAITYRNFSDKEAKEAKVKPYCLKAFRQRWYLAGKTADGLRIYALDRISSLQPTGKKFKMPKDFNAEDIFCDYFGIVIDNENFAPCKIKIKAFDGQQDYFRSLPLHHSQKEVETTEDYSIFQYYMSPSWDFEMELMRYHSRVEVLEPESLREKVLALAKATVARYDKQ